MRANAPFCCLAHLSQFPCRWKWFFYINPLSWTLYGIIVTQLGDQENLISTGGGSLPALESAAWCLGHSHSRQGWHLPTANKHWLCIMFCGTGLHVASCKKHCLKGKMILWIPLSAPHDDLRLAHVQLGSLR